MGRRATPCTRDNEKERRVPFRVRLAAHDLFSLPQQMPRRNFARIALVAHCVEQTADEEAASQLLDRVVRNDEDFLVTFATGGPSRNFFRNFSASDWVAAYPNRPPYPVALVDAYVRTPGLVLPEAVWESSTFRQIFRDQIRRTLAKRMPRRHNLDNVRAHPIAGQLLAECECQMPPDLERVDHRFEMLIQMLQRSLPPPSVVDRLVPGTDYTVLLERLEPYVDVESALGSGRRRWITIDCERTLSAISILLDGVDAGQSRLAIGNAWAESQAKRTRNIRERRRDRYEAGRAVKAWRIFTCDQVRWRSALTDEEWSTYHRLEAELRDRLPRGAFSHVLRRRFSQNSVAEMRNSNLSSLRRECEARASLSFAAAGASPRRE